MRTIQDLKIGLEFAEENERLARDREGVARNDAVKYARDAAALKSEIAAHPDSKMEELIVALREGASWIEKKEVVCMRAPYQAKGAEFTIVTVRVPGRL